MDKLTDGDAVKAAKVTPTSDASSSKAPSKDKDGAHIRLGHYVMFFDKNNEKLRGIVRWIGTNKSVQSDGTPIVGIEAVSYNQSITCTYVHVFACYKTFEEKAFVICHCSTYGPNI